VNLVPLEKPVRGANGALYQLHRVEGDQSALHPFDRLPEEVWKVIQEGRSVEQDRSPGRKTLPCPYPGKSIQELARRHSGACAILFNGHSLAGINLSGVEVPMIGMNRTFVGHPTWDGPDPDYLCVLDSAWLSRKQVANHPGLINGSRDPRRFGYRAVKSYRMAPFSFDLARDGFVSPTTGHLALQVAVYMGFTHIYCLGLDLRGKHFDGTPGPSNDGQMVSQAKMLKEALPLLRAKGITVWASGGGTSLLPQADLENIGATRGN